MIIITNNKLVDEYYGGKNVQLLEGSYQDVLYSVRDYVHKNYKLLTHPLSGSVKPNETPFKSVALEIGDKLDFNSVEMIENAIYTYSKLQNDSITPNWTETVLEDFRVIDLDLIKNALTTEINSREMFMKWIDYSYYYEEE